MSKSRDEDLVTQVVVLESCAMFLFMPFEWDKVNKSAECVPRDVSKQAFRIKQAPVKFVVTGASSKPQLNRRDIQYLSCILTSIEEFKSKSVSQHLKARFLGTMETPQTGLIHLDSIRQVETMKDSIEVEKIEFEEEDRIKVEIKNLTEKQVGSGLVPLMEGSVVQHPKNTQVDQSGKRCPEVDLDWVMNAYDVDFCVMNKFMAFLAEKSDTSPPPETGSATRLSMMSAVSGIDRASDRKMALVRDFLKRLDGILGKDNNWEELGRILERTLEGAKENVSDGSMIEELSVEGQDQHLPPVSTFFVKEARARRASGTTEAGITEENPGKEGPSKEQEGAASKSCTPNDEEEVGQTDSWVNFLKCHRLMREIFTEVTRREILNYVEVDEPGLSAEFQEIVKRVSVSLASHVYVGDEEHIARFMEEFGLQVCAEDHSYLKKICSDKEGQVKNGSDKAQVKVTLSIAAETVGKAFKKCQEYSLKENHLSLGSQESAHDCHRM